MELTSKKYSFLPFLPLSFYQEKYGRGEISRKILQHEIEVISQGKWSSEEVDKALFQYTQEVCLPENTFRPLHKKLKQELGQSLTELTDPILVRLLASYYDQGLSYWKMPGTDKNFKDCVLELSLNTFCPLVPLKTKIIKQFKSMSSYEIIDFILDKLFSDQKLKELYLEESLLSLRGWSGMINVLALNPELNRKKRSASLDDYVAVRLMIEYCWCQTYNFKKKLALKDFPLEFLDKKELIDDNTWMAYRIWHESYEKSYHLHKLKEITANISQPKTEDFQIQAFFCIDDRGCGVRRNLEQLNPRIETFGTPGHFGLDFYFQEKSDRFPIKHCPAPIKTQRLVELVSGLDVNLKKNFQLFHDLLPGLIGEIVLTFIEGLWVALKFFAKIFLPRIFLEEGSQIISHHESEIKFSLWSENQAECNHSVGENRFRKGFTREEAANLIAAVFNSTGIRNKFARLILMIGHNSTTTNNPYFSAYGCGACSGRSGAINSNVFCQLANDQGVRTILAQKHSITIPHETYFLAGLHDTTKDTMTLFGTGKMSMEHKSLLTQFEESAAQALKMNALDRCRDFASVAENINSSAAIQETKKRAESIFEPRPELGHTRNALCLVGRRSITKNLSFHRRAFLQSYDCRIDADGKILAQVLSAAIPVTGGINLDYFYARMNNLGIGAGSKLSHNVVGLFGLTNGVEDDLLPGLPYQMVELHEPVRIMIVCEHYPEVLLQMLRDNPNLSQWVENDWVKFACVHPDTLKLSYFANGKFEDYDGLI